MTRTVSAAGSRRSTEVTQYLLHHSPPVTPSIISVPTPIPTFHPAEHTHIAPPTDRQCSRQRQPWRGPMNCDTVDTLSARANVGPSPDFIILSRAAHQCPPGRPPSTAGCPRTQRHRPAGLGPAVKAGGSGDPEARGSCYRVRRPVAGDRGTALHLTSTAVVPCSAVQHEPTANRLQVSDSARLGSARLGSARLGSVRLGLARLGSARSGYSRDGGGGRPRPSLRVVTVAASTGAGAGPRPGQSIHCRCVVQ